TADPDLSRVPEPFVPIIRKALAKDPQRRYPTVAEMLDDVRRTSRRDPASGQSPWLGKKTPLTRDDPGLQRAARGEDVRAKPLVIRDEDGDDEGIILGPLRENPVSPWP